MKNLINLITLVVMTLLFTSCKSDTKSKEKGGIDVDISDAIKTAESRRGTDPDASGGNTCLLGYQTKYDELLTADMVIAAAGFSKEKMEVSYSKAFASPEYQKVKYEFKNKRKAYLESLKGDYVIEDEINFGSMKPMSLSQFRQMYKIPTEEENAMMDKVMDDITDGKSESEEANEKLKDLEKKGVDKKTVKDVGSMMKDTFKKIDANHTVVAGLGDAASWNGFTNELHVLDNGVVFQIYVFAKDGVSGNKDLAVTLAKEVLAKCK